MFEIGSIGKSFTNVALMQLRDEGRLDLQAPVSRYLPWFEVQSEYGPITTHHLMTHTSGLVSGNDIGTHGLYEAWALRDSAGRVRLPGRILPLLQRRLQDPGFPAWKSWTEDRTRTPFRHGCWTLWVCGIRTRSLDTKHESGPRLVIAGFMTTGLSTGTTALSRRYGRNTEWATAAKPPPPMICAST